jgi:NADH-quinone oxidoreductase subunit K
MLDNYLVVGAILFALGAVGFLTRRNMIVMFLCAEMMLQGVSINLVAFGNAWGNWHGQVFTIYVLTVAAAEAAIALALVLVLYRRRGSLDISLWQDLREADQPPIIDEPTAEPVAAPEPAWPKLTPSGVEPPRSQEEELELIGNPKH